MLGRVMKLVEAPEQRNFMGPAVAPVKPEIGDRKSRKAAQPDRPGRHRRVQPAGHQMVGEIADDRQRNGQKQVRQYAVEAIEAEIPGEGLTDALLRMQRKQLFQRNENE